MSSVTPNPDEVPTVEEKALELDSTATASKVEAVSGTKNGAGTKGDNDVRQSQPDGPRKERRRKTQRPETHRAIKFDDKGNAVLEVNVDTPRRREDDDTVDFLKSLDSDGLDFADEAKPATDEQNDTHGFNPYNKGTKPRR